MTYRLTSPPEALVDFMAIRDDSYLGVSRAFVTGLEPTAGDLIRLRDLDGNECQAVVSAVRERSLLTRIIWETWITQAAERDDFPRATAPVQGSGGSEPTTGLVSGELVQAS